VRNNPAAIDRLQKVLKQHGINLVVDPGSESALKGSPGKTSFLVYAENVHPEELAKILKQLAAEEKKAANPFDKVKVSSLSKHEHLQVASLLGTDPTKRNQGTTVGIKPGPKPKPAGKVERVAVVLPQEPAAKASEPVRQFLLQPADAQPGALRVLVRIHQN
jgi:hypothetical protein